MIPTTLNLANNLVLNKKFKTEFFKRFLCQRVTGNTWEEFLTNFKRNNFHRKDGKQEIRLTKINKNETNI